MIWLPVIVILVCVGSIGIEALGRRRQRHLWPKEARLIPLVEDPPAPPLDWEAEGWL